MTAHSRTQAHTDTHDVSEQCKTNRGLCASVYVCVCLCVVIFSPLNVFAWGLAGHKMATARAVKLLPTNLQDFYVANREILEELCVQPDLRKDFDKTEGPKHYIDLEHYADIRLPKTSAEAVERIGMERLSKSGWVPWHAQNVYADLVTALRQKNYASILTLSGDLSHYIADMHIPLHTTENFDGQFSGDTGVHARLESDLVEHFPEILVFHPAPAEYIVDTPAKIWAIVLSSRQYVDDVIAADRANAYADRELDGYSIARARGNHGPIIAARMDASAHEVASFWYSAWIDAGRPELPWVDASSLVRPSLVRVGEERVYFEGKLTEPPPLDWPLAVRESYRRAAEYLRMETAVRLAAFEWFSKDGEILVRVKSLETTDSINPKKIQAVLDRLCPGVRIKFRGKKSSP